MKPARPKRKRLRSQSANQLPRLSATAIDQIEARIGYSFKSKDLLHIAFTHSSALAGQDVGKYSNQRMEFLGDRVLGLVIAERLYQRRPTEREGALAPRLNRFVNKGACAEAFRHLDFGQFILLGVSEQKADGQNKKSILGDACEALIGAVYLDGGLKPARILIENAWLPQFGASAERLKDSKTLLQEVAQACDLALPVYREVSRTGPDHALEFVMAVDLESFGSVEASGTSKQAAERAAARMMLDQMDLKNDS